MKLLAWVRTAAFKDFLNDPEQQAARAEAAGIRGVLPEVHDPDLRLDAVGAALHRRGIELHPWIRPTFGVKDPVCRVLSDLEAQRRKFGTPLARACLSNTATLDRALAAMERFAEANRDALDGLHLDYVRNDNALFLMHFPCQCPACQAERRTWLGRGELRPEDMQNPCIAYKELRRRNDRITGFVRRARELTAARTLALSLAARANYLSLDDLWDPPVYGLGPAVFEGQDWAQWAADGLYDFICTMNYHTDPVRFEKVLQEHARLLAGTPATFFCGLGVQSSMGACDAAALEHLLAILGRERTQGACLFSWEALTDAHAAVLKPVADIPPRPRLRS